MGDAPCPWEISEGRAGYVAVIDHEPGSGGLLDEKLGRALSRDTGEPAYVLLLGDDDPRVQAFVRGEYAGDVSARPDDVAAQLGCSLPFLSGSTVPVDLTPRKAPEAAQGELKIAGRTAAQWAYAMKHDRHWSVLLDETGAAGVRQVIASLDHPEPTVRQVACQLIEALGLDRLGSRTEAVISRLQHLADHEPDQRPRAAAQQAIRELAERVVPGFD